MLSVTDHYCYRYLSFLYSLCSVHNSPHMIPVILVLFRGGEGRGGGRGKLIVISPKFSKEPNRKNFIRLFMYKYFEYFLAKYIYLSIYLDFFECILTLGLLPS